MTATEPFQSVLPPRADVDSLDWWVRPWRVICDADWLIAGRGAAAMVDGTLVAVFRLPGGEVLAVDDLDPCSGASVLSRGIVGDADGEPTVASPVYKQRFSLRTGACLDEPDVSIRTWRARISNGRIEVAVQ